MATATTFFARPRNFIVTLLLTGFVAFLSGCGNDAFTNGNNDNNNNPPSTPPAATNPPPTSSKPPPTSGATSRTIVVSYPVTNAIENVGAGFYRRLASVIVTDQDGNAVEDGTPVSLNIIDSVFAVGLINPTTDTITVTTITSQTMSDGSGDITNNPTDFVSAYVNRNYAYRYIEAGDRVFLVNADGRDKDRVVASAPTAANALELTGAVSRSYPSAPYDGSDYLVTSNPPYATPHTTGYVVGASLLGAEISGEDSTGNLTTGIGTTVNGIARFHITYPANTGTIYTGCVANDPRVNPIGSARVFLVATANPGTTSAVTTVNEGFCFDSIAGGSLTAVPSEMTSSGIVAVTPRDGGDHIALPFTGVTATVVSPSGSNITVDQATKFTDETGTVTFAVTIVGAVASGDKIVFSMSDPSGLITTEVAIGG